MNSFVSLAAILLLMKKQCAIIVRNNTECEFESAEEIALKKVHPMAVAHSSVYVCVFSASDAPWTVLLANIEPESTGVTVGGLIPARSYQFRQCAVNDVGRGQFSKETDRWVLSSAALQLLNIKDAADILCNVMCTLVRTALRHRSGTTCSSPSFFCSSIKWLFPVTPLFGLHSFGSAGSEMMGLFRDRNCEWAEIALCEDLMGALTQLHSSSSY